MTLPTQIVGEKAQSRFGFTIRQRIIHEMQEILRNMTDGDGSLPVWRATFVGDPFDRDNKNAPFASLDEGTEDVIEMYGGCTRKSLPVLIHFRFNALKGVDEFDLFKYYLGLIQKAFLSLHEDHPLIRDVREDSNSHTILNTTDAYPGGTVVFVVEYDHARHDPYRLAGEIG